MFAAAVTVAVAVAVARGLQSGRCSPQHCVLITAVHCALSSRSCHPRLSSIANAAFYEGRLRDGVTPADRPPLLVGLPPLVFVESGGQAAVDAYTRSSYNTQEVSTDSWQRFVRQSHDSARAPSSGGLTPWFSSPFPWPGCTAVRTAGPAGLENGGGTARPGRVGG